MDKSYCYEVSLPRKNFINLIIKINLGKDKIRRKSLPLVRVQTQLVFNFQKLNEL